MHKVEVNYSCEQKKWDRFTLSLRPEVLSVRKLEAGYSCEQKKRDRSTSCLEPEVFSVRKFEAGVHGRPGDDSLQDLRTRL